MTLADDRFQYEADTDDANRREYEAQAEQVRDLMEPVLAAATRAAERIVALNLANREIPGFENACGWQPGIRLTNQQMIDQMVAETRQSFTAWLIDPVKELVEQ
jgi:hypothetical protein